MRYIWIGLAISSVIVSLSTSRLSADEAHPATPLHERIDQLLGQSHFGWQAGLAGDAEFLRRVSLDLTGSIPSSDQVRTFLADPSPEKRTRIVDELLASPQFSRYMAVTFDILFMERRADKHVKSPEWEEYLYRSFAENKPLNQLAREILGASGRDLKNRAPAKFYLDREAEPDLLTRDVGRIFFGVDVQCAQCHDHPVIADYSQQDYYGLYAYFSRSYLFEDKKQKVSYLAEKYEGEAQFKSVFTEEQGSAFPRTPGGTPVADPAVALSERYEAAPKKDQAGIPTYSRREQLVAATDGTNRFFNRNWANRLWAHMMGRGLVEPVDLYHSDNPPADPQLLDLLGEELAARNFDIRSLLRDIALSKAYQRSFQVPRGMAELPSSSLSAAAQLDQQIENLEAELDAQSSPLIEASEASSARDAELRDAIEPYAKANKAASDALGKLTAAEQAVKAAQAKHQAKSDALQPLVAAAEATQAAADKLPDEKPVVDAAKLFEARAAKAQAELAPLAQALEKAKSATEPLQTAFDKADNALEPLAQSKREKETAAVEAQSAFTQLQMRRESLLVQVNALRRQRSVFEQLEQFAQLQSAMDETTQEIAGLQTERDALQQMAPAQDEATNARLGELEAETSELETSLSQQQSELEELQEELAHLGTQHFAVAGLKPLTPEQLAWSMMEATGFTGRQRAAVEAEYEKELAEAAKKAGDDAPPAPSEAERAAAIEQKLHAKLAGNLAAFAKVFGAAAGQPQNEFFATVDQALFLSNGGTLQSWLAPGGGNLTDRLLKLEDPAELAEELYVSILSRLPSEAELAQVRSYLADRGDEKAAAVQEMAWGLLTSAEFRFSH